MRNSRIIATGFICALVLTGCAETRTLTYDIQVDEQTEERTLKLILDVQEVVERRSLLDPQLAQLAISATPRRGDRGTLTIGGIKNKAQEEAIRGMLAVPFTLEIKREVVPETDAEDTSTQVERQWEATGITGDQITWIDPVTQDKSGAVGAKISFTPEGKQMFTQLFSEYPGSIIGIFVKDVLVSQLKIDDNATVGDNIVITGVPSLEVAEIFADDVNVGLHTTLIPN